MTAVKGMTWVYRVLFLRTDDDDLFISEAGWDDNPWLTEEQKARMAKGLSPSALKVRKEGKFVKMVGLVCSWFERSTHIVKMKELPPGDDYMAIDFGYSAPCCGLYARVDKDFNLWIFDGWYETGMTNPDIQRKIRLKEAGLGRVTRIGDSAQAADIKQLCDAGIRMVGVKKESSGKENWDQYRAGLLEQYGRISEHTGKPKIYISADLMAINANGDSYNFLQCEMENLRWEEGKGIEGIEQKPEWGKQAKHAIDALSYLLAKISEPYKEEKPKSHKSSWQKMSKYEG